MRSVVVLALVAISATVVSGQNPNVIRRYLQNNPQVVQSQLRCLLNTGPCDARGTRLRAAMPSIVSTDCASCSTLARTVVSYISSSYPSEYRQIRALYG